MSETPRTKREFLDAAIADLNLDVSDSFTALFAHACALFDQRQAEREATIHHIEARALLSKEIMRLTVALSAAEQRAEAAVSEIEQVLKALTHPVPPTVAQWAEIRSGAQKRIDGIATANAAIASAAEQRAEGVVAAIKNLRDVKGRHHTEMATVRLFKLLDAAIASGAGESGNG